MPEVPIAEILTDVERRHVESLTDREATEYERGYLDALSVRLVHESPDRTLLKRAIERQGVRK